MSKILVIEDDRVILSGVIRALQAEGHEVLIADNGSDGLYMAKTTQPALVILDIMMPGLNGFEVTTELRRDGDPVPLIILSARAELKDKVRGLDLGADDYMTKPFELDELLARVRRHLGRSQERKQVFGELEYDWKLQVLHRKQIGTAIALAQKERRLLEFLLKRSGQIVTREQVLDGVWGADYDGTDRTVDNVIVSLRKKIGAAHLITERGEGYRFVTNP